MSNAATTKDAPDIFLFSIIVIIRDWCPVTTAARRPQANLIAGTDDDIGELGRDGDTARFGKRPELRVPRFLNEYF